MSEVMWEQPPVEAARKVRLHGVTACLVAPDGRELTRRIPVVHGVPTRFPVIAATVMWVAVYQGDVLVQRASIESVFGGRFDKHARSEVLDADMLTVGATVSI